MTRQTGLLVAAALLFGLSGCARTVDVEGVVTYRGKPIISGSVIFIAADRTTHSGIIEPDGTYYVEGLPPGPVKIAVVSQDPAKGRTVQVGDKILHRTGRGKRKIKGAANKPPPPAKGWFPLPAQLADADTSGLTWHVPAGPATFPIELN